LGKTDQHTEKDTGISVSSGHDLAQVVTAWAKLPSPLKAAILAIIHSTFPDTSPSVPGQTNQQKVTEKRK
jgi:hypothetical protein